MCSDIMQPNQTNGLLKVSEYERKKKNMNERRLEMKLPPIQWNWFVIFSVGWHSCHRNEVHKTHTTIGRQYCTFCQWSYCASSKVIVIVQIKWVFRLKRARQLPKRSDRNWIDLLLHISVYVPMFYVADIDVVVCSIIWMYRFFHHFTDIIVIWHQHEPNYHWTWTFDIRMKSSLTMSVVAFDCIIMRH